MARLSLRQFSTLWRTAWLKTLRKKNVYVVFATQEVADAASKPELLSTILSACHTKIFLPDEEALTPAMMQAYQTVGLTTAEIDILAKAQKKRDYYYRSVKGRRLFELGLGPAALAFVGASSEKDQRFLDELCATRPASQYAFAMLERGGVPWPVAELELPRADSGATDDAETVRMPCELPLLADALVSDAETIPMSISALHELVSAEALDSDAVTHPVAPSVPAPRTARRWRKKAP